MLLLMDDGVVPSTEGTEDAAQGTAGSSGSSGVVIDRLNARRTSPAQCPKFRRVGLSMQACPCCTAGGPNESRSRKRSKSHSMQTQKQVQRGMFGRRSSEGP